MWGRHCDCGKCSNCLEEQNARWLLEQEKKKEEEIKKLHRAQESVMRVEKGIHSAFICYI